MNGFLNLLALVYGLLQCMRATVYFTGTAQTGYFSCFRGRGYSARRVCVLKSDISETESIHKLYSLVSTSLKHNHGSIWHHAVSSMADLLHCRCVEAVKWMGLSGLRVVLCSNTHVITSSLQHAHTPSSAVSQSLSRLCSYTRSTMFLRRFYALHDTL
jgi:hypothetical protein